MAMDKDVKQRREMTEKLKYHRDMKKYTRVRREVATDVFEDSRGYVIDFSKDFILMQNTDNFDVDGYSIFPVKSIAEVRFTNNEKYYDRIMHAEGLKSKVVREHKIDLTSWTSIFRSIKTLGLNVIIENEDPQDESFDIGPITKATKTAVYVRYFDAQGYLDKEPTKIAFDLITITKFNERYTNIFSKHLRERKSSVKKKS
jgi:hypothetical protein